MDLRGLHTEEEDAKQPQELRKTLAEEADRARAKLAVQPRVPNAERKGYSGRNSPAKNATEGLSG